MKSNQQFFRYNQIYRQTVHQGKLIIEEKVITNFAPVLYSVDEDSLKKNGTVIISQ